MSEQDDGAKDRHEARSIIVPLLGLSGLILVVLLIMALLGAPTKMGWLLLVIPITWIVRAMLKRV